MYYHFAFLLLFRPFIKLRFIRSDVVPRDVCSQAADAISALARSYSRLYTLRRAPSFVPYFRPHNTHGASSPQQLLQGVTGLKEMGSFHTFATSYTSKLPTCTIPKPFNVSFFFWRLDLSSCSCQPGSLCWLHAMGTGLLLWWILSNWIGDASPRGERRPII